MVTHPRFMHGPYRRLELLTNKLSNTTFETKQVNGMGHLRRIIAILGAEEPLRSIVASLSTDNMLVCVSRRLYNTFH